MTTKFWCCPKSLRSFGVELEGSNKARARYPITHCRHHGEASSDECKTFLRIAAQPCACDSTFCRRVAPESGDTPSNPMLEVLFLLLRNKLNNISSANVSERKGAVPVLFQLLQHLFASLVDLRTEKDTPE